MLACCRAAPPAHEDDEIRCCGFALKQALSNTHRWPAQPTGTAARIKQTAGSVRVTHDPLAQRPWCMIAPMVIARHCRVA